MIPHLRSLEKIAACAKVAHRAQVLPIKTKFSAALHEISKFSLNRSSFNEDQQLRQCVRRLGECGLRTDGIPVQSNYTTYPQWDVKHLSTDKK